MMLVIHYTWPYHEYYFTGEIFVAKQFDYHFSQSVWMIPTWENFEECSK